MLDLFFGKLFLRLKHMTKFDLPLEIMQPPNPSAFSSTILSIVLFLLVAKNVKGQSGAYVATAGSDLYLNSKQGGTVYVNNQNVPETVPASKLCLNKKSCLK
jgi:hypothetical protein